MQLSIIMPMYNAENIVDNLKEVKKELDGITNRYELIVVNDGSTNNCFEEAKKFRDARVKIVGYKKNQGKGYAIKYGFRYATGENVIFLDSGGDLNAKQIKNFIRIMKETNADIVIGSKKHPQSKVYYPLLRRLMSFTYQTLNKILFNLDVRDTQVGLKLFKKSVLEKDIPKPLLQIGGKPTLCRLMDHYAKYGIEEFILCVGYLGDKIEDYFKQNPVKYNVKVVDTGNNCTK